MHRTALIVICALGVVACSQGGGNGSATAKLKSKSGTQVSGTATFTERGGKVEIVVNIRDLPAGKHGVYLQDVGDCTGANAAAVGKRFAPGGDERGGVLGDVEAGESGNASLIASSDKLTVAKGEGSVMGRSIVVSGDPDNPEINETFGIIACGVVGLPEDD
jgi:Cu-Zn family superoxide dismutase